MIFSSIVLIICHECKYIHDVITCYEIKPVIMDNLFCIIICYTGSDALFSLIKRPTGSNLGNMSNEGGGVSRPLPVTLDQRLRRLPTFLQSLCGLASKIITHYIIQNYFLLMVTTEVVLQIFGNHFCDSRVRRETVS